MSSALGVLASLQTALQYARSCRRSSSEAEVNALSFRHAYVKIAARFQLTLRIVNIIGAMGFISSLYVIQLRLCRHLRSWRKLLKNADFMRLRV